MTASGPSRLRGGDGLPAARAGRTAYDWLRRNAALAPDAPAVTVCRLGREDERHSFTELLTAADRAAAGLCGRGVRPGDRVVLSLPNDLSFPAVTLACLAIGAIAVPAPVPGISRVSAFRERIAGIVSDCSPRLTVTTAQWLSQVGEAVASRQAATAVTPWEMLRDTTQRLAAADADPAGVAILQYTSGSTRRPRGVMITHDMLRASCRQAAAAYRETPADVAVTWVPLYHDMGLVTGTMRPMFTQYESVLLEPERFARSPASWPQAIARHRATLSSAPNFAYDLCVRKVSQEVADGMDLTTWRVARNAGEVVRAETLDRFTARFAGAGLRPDAMSPSYGLAEATLTVTSSGPGRPSLRVTVLPADLVPGGRVSEVPQEDGRPPGTVLQSSGVPLTQTRIHIDGTTAEGTVGRISVEGPQVSPGYWPEPRDVSGSGKRPRRVETGDLGFLYRGHLFVLGRVDDTFVRYGQNYYASDVSAVCGRVDGVRPGRVAAFTATPDPGGTAGALADQVVVVAELRAGADPTAQLLERVDCQVRDELARALDLYVSRVAFLPAGALPVTTSGKVRTSEVRRRLGDGSLPLLAGSGHGPDHPGNGAADGT